jgi:hypothetical protein
MYAYQTHERLFVRLSCSNSNIEQHLPSALFIPQIIKIISKIRKFPPVVFLFLNFVRVKRRERVSTHLIKSVAPKAKRGGRRRRKYLKKMEITVSHAYYETHSRRGERVGVKSDQ